MTDARLTTPKRVVDKAIELGAHEQCIRADHPGACILCSLLVHQAFEHFYGHAANAQEAMDMIVIDLMNDLTND